MANYEFDRFNILVAEDNQFIRSTVVQSMRAIGVGGVQIAADASEAIELFRKIGDDPAKSGMMPVDIIFSNWQMSPVDGMMLLRWVRRHKESPNRFIPFVMVTGYADPEKVREARDMGVTEMMAKPFSVSTIGARLLQVIDRPRQFIHNSDYFGPDRRRTPGAAPDKKDRRIRTEKEIEIIYDDS